MLGKDDKCIHSHDHEHSHDHDHGHSGDHGHHHIAKEQRAIINRLSKAIGHLESVKRMVEEDRDCSEVLIQLSAVRSAINNTGKVILKGHLEHCIIDAVRDDDMAQIDALSKAIDQFIK
ncbi:metal-sensing transcriptional repressor [Eubacterium aggregans]|uniref:metal-sensing transcriptional repressor n=1 Tax=Eubacterium aggregans TaxID=81409 RepID=UPI003F380AAF